MDTFFTTLTGWVPLAFLGFAFFSTRILNENSSRTGKVAEILAWAATVATFITFALWLIQGRINLSATLTEAGVLGVRLDTLSLPILGLVTFLGAVIVRFSRNYLSGDANQGGFFKWLMVTLGAVISLVLSPGLVQFWLSWVVCSLGLHHLLVYFPDRLGTLLSARKKFIVSRLGDLFLILSFIGIYRVFGTQNFSELFAQTSAQPELLANHTWIAWCIVGGAVLKSAQFPFHTWLPDTMGTPTPVSALMHAGIINAGGYLVIRMSPFLLESSGAMLFLAVIGALTLICASLVMLTQTSVKRSLAYSTIAQMGFMLLQCGLGAFSLAVLHLIAHSLYKAHSFLSSGSTIANLKRLEPRPVAPLSPIILIGLTGMSIALVGIMAWGWGLSASTKPGLLVFLTVLAMAVSQYLVVSQQQHGSLLKMGRNILGAFGFVALYLGLADGTMRYFSDSLPHQPVGGLALQIILAAILGAYLLITLTIQTQPTGKARPRVLQALYIHALNGFYLNTLANRFSRAAGLVPAGR
ncbi:proton-conducting transporter transmembrane domain-containing protein [Puniceicoccus vermicola]|uniref:Probable inorganic carbon transporter subunit DabB n=1 Tax=Puniceicoccus vermicola TaxID=388746 RepID=A0A7X1E3Q4_9BACT|nr:proton-conducting transporter membrane subunit [Puniceicoccus vermicola]MBC2601775.1 hypothetical protein [Puniceicoccus vermicola]